MKDDPESLARAMNRAWDVIAGYNHEARAHDQADEVVDFDRLPFPAQKLITVLICPPQPVSTVEVVIGLPKMPPTTAVPIAGKPPIQLWPVEPCLGAVHRN